MSWYTTKPCFECASKGRLYNAYTGGYYCCEECGGWGFVKKTLSASDLQKIAEDARAEETGLQHA